MKRFILFSGNIYYAAGGWLDGAKMFDTWQDAAVAARARIENHDADWYQIVDLDLGKIIIKSIEEAHS